MNLLGYTIVFMALWSHILLAPTSDVTSSSGQSLNGNTLVALGTQLKNPLLKLVGLALQNSQAELLCELQHRCEVWSRWSACPVTNLGTFGVRNRTRQCGGTRGNCQTNDPEMTDIEISLCEGQCPQSYNYTEERYCLRYVHKAATQAEAESTCKSDGGFLININSQNKLDSVTKMLDGFEDESCMWVDGKRSSNTSSWVFSYEEEKQGFKNWGPGDPDNSGTDLCSYYLLRSSHGGWRKFDGTCTYRYYFLCEVTAGEV